MKPFEGIFPIMLTPYFNGALDDARTRHLVDYLIDAAERGRPQPRDRGPARRGFVSKADRMREMATRGRRSGRTMSPVPQSSNRSCREW